MSSRTRPEKIAQAKRTRREQRDHQAVTVADRPCVRVALVLFRPSGRNRGRTAPVRQSTAGASAGPADVDPDPRDILLIHDQSLCRAHHQGGRAKLLEPIEQRLGGVVRLESGDVGPNPARRNAVGRRGLVPTALGVEPSQPPAITRCDREVRASEQPARAPPSSSRSPRDQGGLQSRWSASGQSSSFLHRRAGS